MKSSRSMPAIMTGRLSACDELPVSGIMRALTLLALLLLLTLASLLISLVSGSVAIGWNGLLVLVTGLLLAGDDA